MQTAPVIVSREPQNPFILGLLHFTSACSHILLSFDNHHQGIVVRKTSKHCSRLSPRTHCLAFFLLLGARAVLAYHCTDWPWRKLGRNTAQVSVRLVLDRAVEDVHWKLVTAERADRVPDDDDNAVHGRARV